MIVLIAEETHLYASKTKEKRSDLGESIFVRLQRMGRKLGICTVVLDQSPYQLAPAVTANVSTRIVLRLANSADLRSLAFSLGLEDEEADALAELATRRALVQTSENPQPFLIEIVNIPERTKCTPEELEDRERESLALLDHELAEIDLGEVLLGPEKDQESGSRPEIWGDLYKVLTDICECPRKVILERCETLQMDRTRELKARAQLEKLGMIQLADTVGRRSHLYAATSKGKAWAQAQGISFYTSKGSIAHEAMAWRVKERLGHFSTRISFVSEGEGLGISSVQPDLLARIRDPNGDTSRRVAIQIICSNKAEYEAKRSIDLCHIKEVEVVMLIARNKRTAKTVERKIAEMRQRFCREGCLKERCPQVVDFETCTAPGYRWDKVLGIG